MVKQKSKELRKFTQKKKKLKRSDKVIQSIEENNDAKAKLIEKLKEKAHRTVKEIIATKSINKENKLNDNNDLKDLIFISKSSKNKPGFTKSAISMQSSSCIQAQFINLISTGKLLPFTSSWFRLTIPFYQDSVTSMLMLKCKNMNMV